MPQTKLCVKTKNGLDLLWYFSVLYIGARLFKSQVMLIHDLRFTKVFISPIERVFKKLILSSRHRNLKCKISFGKSSFSESLH